MLLITRSLLFKSMLLCFTFFTLTGCGSTGEALSKIGKIIQDPSIQVGGPLDQPSTLNLTLLSDPDINKNETNQPSPIELKVIYLSEDSKLLSAYYEQLSTEDIKDVLGKNYIEHQDYTLLPSQFKAVPQIILDKSNNYLGVVAYYSDSGQTEWKKVIKLRGVGHKYSVLVHLKGTEVELRKDEE
ncbi:TPA: type VI secretion system lipoprotein TssJ [Pasteurella multocida]|nr:type VI secretion system lipoprotein TssJ [Pasteurella multocida]